MREYKLTLNAPAVSVALPTRTDQNAVEEFFGLCRGLFADRQLNAAKADYLRTWLDQALQQHPIELFRQVRKATQGRNTEEILGKLARILPMLVTQREDQECQYRAAPIAVFDDPPPAAIAIAGLEFCLSGSFVRLSRQEATAFIESRGGAVNQSVRKRTNYLVVGSQASADWKHGNYGTKIEKALRLRESGHPIRILREADWVRLLGIAN